MMSCEAVIRGVDREEAKWLSATRTVAEYRDEELDILLMLMSMYD
jgi:hypothetical protein